MQAFEYSFDMVESPILLLTLIKNEVSAARMHK